MKKWRSVPCIVITVKYVRLNIKLYNCEFSAKQNNLILYYLSLIIFQKEFLHDNINVALLSREMEEPDNRQR